MGPQLEGDTAFPPRAGFKDSLKITSRSAPGAAVCLYRILKELVSIYFGEFWFETFLKNKSFTS